MKTLLQYIYIYIYIRACRLACLKHLYVLRLVILCSQGATIPWFWSPSRNDRITNDIRIQSKNDMNITNAYQRMI